MHVLSAADHHTVVTRGAPYDLKRESGNTLFVCESRSTFLVESDVVGGTELVEVVDGRLEIGGVAENGISEAGNSGGGGDISEYLDEAERSAI